MHPLLRVLLDAVDGRFPPVDGGVTRVDPPGRVRAVVAFTGHTYVMAHAPIVAPPGSGVPDPDGFGGSHDPRYITWLAGASTAVGTLDATLVARGTGRAVGSLQRGDHWDDHDRVQHARSIRDDVQVYGDDRGIVTISTGLAGRRELGVEAHPDMRGTGRGRSLVTDALGLVPEGEPLFAAVSPGNARSMRVFLRLGFTPIGSELQWVADDQSAAASVTIG